MKKRIERKCQPCSGCCDGWVQMVIDGIHVFPGSPCPHSAGNGCDNYENRPKDPCDNFNCGWLAKDSPLPEWMKPNIGKVIVIFNKLQWNGIPVDLAVPVGRRVPPRSLHWLKQFSEKNMRPFIYTEQIVEAGKYQAQQKVFGYGSPAFQQELLLWQQQGRKLW